MSKIIYFVIFLKMSLCIACTSRLLVSNKVIQGSAPYLLFNKEKVNSLEQMFHFSILKNNKTSIYDATTIDTDEKSPLLLPDEFKKISDVSFVIMDKLEKNNQGEYEYELINYIQNKNNFVDDDGDDKNNVTVTGKIILTINDKYGDIVSLDEEYNDCLAPYKFTITSTNVTVLTRYGFPKMRLYPSVNKTFFIQKETLNLKPKACFAQAYVGVYSKTKLESDFVINKGFKVVNNDVSSKNFPRTGFNGAFFHLVLNGITAQEVINKMGKTVQAESGEGVTITLDKGPSDDLLKITLNGPRDITHGGQFSPSVFKIKAGNNKVIYSFKISKWFIAKIGRTLGYANAIIYCHNLIGNYHMPSVSEYTNGKLFAWDYSKNGQVNDYYREIGDGTRKYQSIIDDGAGGLLSEWGDVGGIHWLKISSTYQNSGFESNYYWAVDPYDFKNKWGLTSQFGPIINNSELYSNKAVSCVDDGQDYLPVITPEGNYYDIQNNPSNANNPIELDSGEKFANFLIKKEVAVNISDAKGRTVQLTDTINGCDDKFSAPYKLRLSKGNKSVDYYFKLRPRAKVCYAQPRLDKVKRDDVKSDFVDGKGFIVIDKDVPSKNFPRTGFNNAFFNLVLHDVTAQTVITKMGTMVSPESGKGVTLKLEKGSNDNLLKVTLKGPNSVSKGGSFMPSIFKIKADKDVIYSFEISKWFIERSGAIGSHENAIKYCNFLDGNYRLPSTSELTNVNSRSWNYGTPGIYKFVHRAIGNGKQQIKQVNDDGVGGLISEWGGVAGKRPNQVSEYYVNSKFENAYYWALERCDNNPNEHLSMHSGSFGFLTCSTGHNKVHNVVCVTSGDDYLPIITSDGKFYNTLNNPSTAINPIELKTGSKFSEFEISSKVNIKITDANGKDVQLADALDGCDVKFTAPYRLNLSTENNKVDYYFKLKPSDIPKTCYVQANIVNSTEVVLTNDFVKDKGFKVIDVNEPSRNFPRTGFDGAFFNLVLDNVTAKEVITQTGVRVTPESGTGVIIKLEEGASDNILKISLIGANHTTKGGKFTPATFKIKAGNTIVYSFKVSKWFVAKPDDSLGYSNAQLYCKNLRGNYRIPSVSEYTNSNGDKWAYGAPGVSNGFSRAIGNGKQRVKQINDDSFGSMLSEWGKITQTTYPGSNFVTHYYWTIDNHSANYPWLVSTGTGFIEHSYFNVASYKVACVTP